MINKFLTTLLGTASVLATFGVAHQAAAMNTPSAMQIDGGPLGTLDVSGGFDGSFYAYSGTGAGSILGNGKSAGANMRVVDIKVAKPDGLLRFTVEVKPDTALYFGVPSSQIRTDQFTLGPVFSAYLTLVPNKAFNISVGQVPSVEGWEASTDWENANIIDSPIYYVENSSSRGVSASLNEGPVSATVIFGDGVDSGVFNTFQGLVTYSFNGDNALSVFGAANVGRTGPNTYAYDGGKTGTGYPGYNAAYANSNMIGGYYDYTSGNLNIVPELQYIYSKVDHVIGLDKFTSNFGAEVITDYQFGQSPWSVGGQFFYYKNNGPQAWYLNAHSGGFGVGVTPTWQHGNLFARGEVGLLHLTNLGIPAAGGGFGASGTDRNQVLGVLEAGVMF